jgi:hypothetical protein
VTAAFVPLRSGGAAAGRFRIAPSIPPRVSIRQNSIGIASSLTTSHPKIAR